MKILVLSDSHSALQFMRQCVESVKPDAIIHLGDFFDDGVVIHEENPDIPFYQVPGNCDRFRCPSWQPETLVQPVFGVNLFMTHGHRQNVKMGLGALLKDARASRVDAVLYGHTHQADCCQEPDGLWILNPGSCGYGGGTAGLIQVENRKIVSCRILRDENL